MKRDVSAQPASSSPLSPAADYDVLRFLSRTLQSHVLDAKPQDVLAKLQNLLVALEQQQSTLSHWPDSPSKSRICAALASARNAVSQTVDDLNAAAQTQPDSRAAKAQ